MWMEPYEDVMALVLDMRSARLVLKESTDWPLVLKHCQSLTAVSKFGKLAFRKLTKAVMVLYVIQYTTSQFEELLQRYHAMTLARNNACQRAIRDEMERMGADRELKGNRTIEIPHFNDKAPVPVGGVGELVDAVWAACLRNAARAYNLVEIEIENKAFSALPHPFGVLVGDAVMCEINAVRRKINEALPLAEVKTGATLVRPLGRHCNLPAPEFG